MDQHHINSKAPSLNAPEKEKHLTRQQRRAQDVLKQEVEATYNHLTSKFLDFFTLSDDPQGQAVVDKMDQIGKQWRLYCERKKLIPTLYPIVDNYMKALMNEYVQEEAKDIVQTLTPEEAPQG